ncbi:MAG TPA: energy transducer TonB [Pyrinomonadaceae bacterium]|nr:energy transducer TonB [Pyrinomonadaceae bacterium]
MLTLIIGLGLGSLFQSRNWRGQSRRNSCGYTERHRSTTADTLVMKYRASDSTPLAILFEPSTRMTAAARRNQTYGVVQLLVEYGADGKARVLSRVTSLPDGLTEEAERVAELTQFRPETRGGEPVSVTRVQSYYFNTGRF